MNRLVTCMTLLMIAGASAPASGAANAASEQGPKRLRVYRVNKKFSAFPLNDFSTPESACATIYRIGVAVGASRNEWKRLNCQTLRQAKRTRRDTRGPDERRKVPPEHVKMYNNGVIREVRIYKGKLAGVFIEFRTPGKTTFERRTVLLEDGRWLNGGQSGFVSMEQARKRFSGYMVRRLSYLLPEEYPPRPAVEEKPRRPAVEDPDAHLKPFVQFLKQKAEDPKAFVLKALAKHKVVIMGETHHRPRYWAFNASVVEDPQFAKHVGVIYMEMPMNDQPLLDEFLASKELDTAPVIEMLRDILWMGRPDRPMLEFFVTVWKVNQTLPREKQLRIVAVDMQRPWKKIRKRGDWSKYNCDRDELMAENIVKDLQKNRADKRHAFFIVGVGHTSLNLMRPDNSTPIKDAGWHLCRNLGADSVYAFVQHMPVQTNMGRVDGRLCLGLFDTAFAALENKPMAFPLTEGPFGRQWFDAMPDDPVSESSTYGDGYSAFLYLGPLEDEIFSPLIPGFYDEEFMREIDRRFRLMFGKAWHEAYGEDATNVENFVDWMSGSAGSWGQPRRKWIAGMGPLDAWHWGDQWEKELQQKTHKYAQEHPEVVREAARQFLEAIQKADYDNIAELWGLPYLTKKWVDRWVEWICDTFRSNPIEKIELGDVGPEKDGRFPIPYTLTLKDGKRLEGVLQFSYLAREKQWEAAFGADWHLKYPDGLPKKE